MALGKRQTDFDVAACFPYQFIEVNMLSVYYNIVLFQCLYTVIKIQSYYYCFFGYYSV